MHAAEITDITAASAWQQLSELAGLDLKGPDAGFDEQVCDCLAPDADNLDHALSEAQAGELLRAMFEVAQIHQQIVDEILHDGGRHTQLTPQDIRDLKNEAAEWRGITGRFAAPALDCTGAWRVHAVLCNHELVRAAQAEVAGAVPEWLEPTLLALERDIFPPMPEELLPERWPVYLQPTVSFVTAALNKARGFNLTRRKLLAHWSFKGHPAHPGNALDIWSIAQNEADDYLKTMLISLAALRRTGARELLELGFQIRQITDQYATIPIEPQLRFETFYRLFGSAGWKRRHEMYAAWVMGEGLKELSARGIGYAYEQVGQTNDTPAGAVPPDAHVSPTEAGFALYRGSSCELALQCTRSRRRTSGTLRLEIEKFARSVPHAQMYLADRASLERLREGLTPHARRHCTVIPHLVPANTAARQILRNVMTRAAEAIAAARLPATEGEGSPP